MANGVRELAAELLRREEAQRAGLLGVQAAPEASASALEALLERYAEPEANPLDALLAQYQQPEEVSLTLRDQGEASGGDAGEKPARSRADLDGAADAGDESAHPEGRLALTAGVARGA